MAVHFNTSKAADLLKKFDARITQTEQEGKITTWEKSDDGKYYTHKAADWKYKAWFKPNAESEQLTFNIIKPENANVSTITYGYYHGHLIETFLNHFEADFKLASASAYPESGDVVSTKT